MIWVVHWGAVPAYLGELQMVLEEAYSVLPYLQRDTMNPPGFMAAIHYVLHIAQELWYKSKCWYKTCRFVVLLV